MGFYSHLTLWARAAVNVSGRAIARLGRLPQLVIRQRCPNPAVFAIH